MAAKIFLLLCLILSLATATMADQTSRLVLKHEGLRLHAYSSGGISAIGVGHNLKCDNDRRHRWWRGGISRSFAMVLFRADLARARGEVDVYPFWNRLNDARRAAIVDLDFVAGQGGLNRMYDFIFDLTVGKFPDAARALRTSPISGKIPERIDEDAHIIETGEMG